MRKGIVRRAGTAVLVVAALAVVVGCSASRRSNSRMQVLQAENVDLMQRTQSAETQARDAQLAQDRSTVALQQERHRAVQLDGQLSVAERRAASAALATQELNRSRQDNLRTIDELREVQEHIARIEALAARPKPCAPAAPPPTRQMAYDPSPHNDAFAQDLRGRLVSANINLPVEVRTTRDGQQLRVAVVLENAFPAGKSSLSYNMDAVRAVVGLGQLITRSYPGSQVRVEGHTDRDPPRKCPFPSNEALSRARADSVREILVKSGVRSDLIQVDGHGARYPLAAGNTDRAKAQNRRVEIFIEPRT